MLLITASEVVNLAFAARETISPSSIRSLKIDIAQEHFLRPRVGEALFDEMTEGQHPDLVTNYIKPALACFVRYGMIEELAIAVGDKGALVYSSSTGMQNAEEDLTNDTTINGQTMVTSTRLDQTSDIETTTKTNKTVGSLSIDSSHAVPFPDIVETNSKESETTVIDASDALDKTASLKSDGKDSTTKSDTEQQVQASRGKHTSVDEAFRPATSLELRTLAARALGDGNILLAKAVRYIERNTALFPSYVPSRLYSQIFINPWS
ncbi:MAG: hypothetical protein RR752_01160 [Mucinivorans sp.]